MAGFPLADEHVIISSPFPVSDRKSPPAVYQEALDFRRHDSNAQPS
jgi:hypothetical protein